MEINDIVLLLLLIASVLAVCFVGYALSISIHKFYTRIHKSRGHIQRELDIDHISRVYEIAKDGVYRGDMKASLDGLQELRNIACAHVAINYGCHISSQQLKPVKSKQN